MQIHLTVEQHQNSQLDKYGKQERKSCSTPQITRKVIMNTLNLIHARVAKPSRLKVIKPSKPNVRIFRDFRHRLIRIVQKLNSFFIKFTHKSIMNDCSQKSQEQKFFL